VRNPQKMWRGNQFEAMKGLSPFTTVNVVSAVVMGTKYQGKLLNEDISSTTSFIILENNCISLTRLR